MQEGLESLKQELFAYWEKYSDVRMSGLRIAGFGGHLEALYGADLRKALEDFRFYQFVQRAQRYFGTISKVEKRHLEGALLTYVNSPVSSLSFLSTLNPQRRLPTESAVELITSYIREHPPISNEVYKTALNKELEGRLSQYYVLMEEVEDILSGSDDTS